MGRVSGVLQAAFLLNPVHLTDRHNICHHFHGTRVHVAQKVSDDRHRQPIIKYFIVQIQHSLLLSHTLQQIQKGLEVQPLSFLQRQAGMFWLLSGGTQKDLPGRSCGRLAALYPTCTFSRWCKDSTLSLLMYRLCGAPSKLRGPSSVPA